MARERYTVTDADRVFVAAYIQRKIALDPYWCESKTARRGFPRAKSDTVTLNTWCEKWLDAEQWNQMKNAVRAARKRKADWGGDVNRHPPVNVTLSRKAWMILRDLSKRDGVTLSEFIVDRFHKEWLAEG